MAPCLRTNDSTPQKSVFSFRTVQNTQMDPTRELHIYTDDLFHGKDPITAMRILLANESSIELFEKAGTEIMLERYDSDYKLQPLVAQLRNKFATLRRRQKKAESVKTEKKELSQEEINWLFKDTMSRVATRKRTETKRFVNYSKFKIVKRAPRVTFKTIHSVAYSPNSTASSSLGSSDSDVTVRSL